MRKKCLKRLYLSCLYLLHNFVQNIRRYIHSSKSHFHKEIEAFDDAFLNFIHALRRCLHQTRQCKCMRMNQDPSLCIIRNCACLLNGGLDFMEKKLSCKPERRLSVLWRVSVVCYFFSYSRPILMDYPTLTEALITPEIKLTSVFLQVSSSNSQCICMWMNQDQGSVSGTFRVYNLEFRHLPQKNIRTQND